MQRSQHINEKASRQKEDSKAEAGISASSQGRISSTETVIVRSETEDGVSIRARDGKVEVIVSNASTLPEF